MCVCRKPLCRRLPQAGRQRAAASRFCHPPNGHHPPNGQRGQCAYMRRASRPCDWTQGGREGEAGAWNQKETGHGKPPHVRGGACLLLLESCLCEESFLFYSRWTENILFRRTHTVSVLPTPLYVFFGEASGEASESQSKALPSVWISKLGLSPARAPARARAHLALPGHSAGMHAAVLLFAHACLHVRAS